MRRFKDIVQALFFTTIPVASWQLGGVLIVVVLAAWYLAQGWIAATLSTVAAIVTILAAWTSLASSARIKNIGDSISTKYSGEFPAYFGTIVSAIGSAERSITIVCTISTPGIWSSNRTWKEYCGVLSNKAATKDVEVQIVCGDSQRRRTFVDRQFIHAAHNPADWLNKVADRDFHEDCSTGQTHCQLLQTLLAEAGCEDAIVQELQHWEPASNVPTSDNREDRGEQIVRLLPRVFDYLNVRTLKSSFVLINGYWETDEDLTLWYWVIDENTANAKAVLVVPVPEDPFRGFGFVTADPNLLAALTTRAESIQAQATRVNVRDLMDLSISDQM